LVVLFLALAFHGATQMGYQWKWDRVPRYLWRVIDGELIWGPLLKGLWVTLDLAWKSTLLALVLGALAAWMRQAPSHMGRAIAWIYIELIRNTPLLVQILVCYFILAPTLRQFDDDAIAFQEVINGNAHAVISSEPKPSFFVIRNSDKLFKPTNENIVNTFEGFGLRKGNPAGLVGFNDWIQKNQAWLKQRHQYWFRTQDWAGLVPSI
jgi:His/Glu/Gln/Arg/opine family amino acid ABC transporter permease subunit